MNIDEKLEESIENKYMKNDKGKNKMELTIEESVYILKRKDFNMYVENRAIETLLTAYEKEKGERERIGKLYYEANENCIKYEKELEKEKEKNKKAIDFINERKKTVNKDMAEGTRLQVGTFMWQVDELLEILKEE